MFFGVFLVFQKTLLCFFGFSRFLVLENLENPKNLLLFLDFPVFIEKSKKNTMFCFDFRWFYSKFPKNLLFFDFQ